MCECNKQEPKQANIPEQPVELPPPAPPPLDEADIVRHVQQRFDNGHRLVSIEPSPEMQARIAERDRHLANLKFNEQGDVDRFAIRKEMQD